MSSYVQPSEHGFPTPDPSRRKTRREFAQVLVLVVTFMVLMLTGSVVGLKVMTSTPEPDVAEGRSDVHATSRITYQSADGMTCRKVEFDNRSGLAREGKPEPCYRGPSRYQQRSFVWGR